MLTASVGRRHAIKALTVSLAMLSLARRAVATEEIVFGLTPVLLTHDLDLLASLQAYLERATGFPVRLLQRRTYQEITALLLSGQLTAAWICGYPYVANRSHLSLLAVPIWQGQPLYRSYIIVGKSRKVETPWELKGDIHAFSDPDSNSGYLVTCDLLAQRGLRPNGFFRRSFFTYSHRNVVRAVASGLAESGSVDGYVWEVLNDLEQPLTSATRVLRKSELLGFPPIAALTSQLSNPTVTKLKEALVGMAPDAEGKKVLHMLHLDAFAPEEPSVFDAIAAKMENVRRLG
ncbi:MAG: PhnD/SsuA/transferrin family substrate-binding protein [Rhodomicrobium sp.]